MAAAFGASRRSGEKIFAEGSAQRFEKSGFVKGNESIFLSSAFSRLSPRLHSPIKT
jgi:hypothetical protein